MGAMLQHFALGDCLAVFGAEPDESFDSFVSDPPGGISFMGREWDHDHGHRDRWIRFWRARFELARRKAKPGAYSLTWALPRTAHWTMTALDDAGWQIQDVIVHAFGQGWPKGKSALKPASEHWILARNGSGGALQIDACRVPRGDGVPQFEGRDSKRWNDNGTSPPQRATGERSYVGSWPTNLVLSHCPECEERGTRRVRGEKPRTLNMSAGTQGYGSGGSFTTSTVGGDADGLENVPAFDCLAACDCGASVLAPAGGEPPRCACGSAMWWACPVAEMDRQSGEACGAHGRSVGQEQRLVWSGATRPAPAIKASAGGASRFFPRFTYQAKASGGERDAGCERLYWRRNPRNPFGFDRINQATFDALSEDKRARGNVHPTVKRIALMEWHVSLVTPPAGRVGDLTAGSGGTGIACLRRGCSFLGADICPEAVEIADVRLAWWRTARPDVKPKKRQRPTVDAPQLSLELDD